MASFVQINPPCNLCKTDPLSASELSGKVEDALAGRSPLFSSLLHRLYKMARSGFSLCKKTQNTEKWMMLAIVSAQFAPGGDELIEARLCAKQWLGKVPGGGRFQASAIYAWDCTCIGLSGIQGVEEVKNREKPAKESFSPEKRIILTSKLSF